jgi:hypothetical protein
VEECYSRLQLIGDARGRVQRDRKPDVPRVLLGDAVRAKEVARGIGTIDLESVLALAPYCCPGYSPLKCWSACRFPHLIAPATACGVLRKLMAMRL